MADPADTALYPHAPRIGESVTRWPSGGVATWDGTAWEVTGWARKFRPVEAFDTTNVTSASTTFEAGTPQVSVTYVSPPSGSVYVTVSASLEVFSPSTASCGFEVRQTNVSGVVVAAADSDFAVGVQSADLITASRRKLISGLTPFSTYFFRTMHRTSTAADTATMWSRALLIEPVI
jgi:hypothetical protein